MLMIMHVFSGLLWLCVVYRSSWTSPARYL